MQPYGLPCAFSTEQEVRSKTARKAAPVAVEVNSEGVVQLDGISTRGMLMLGGPETYCRQVTSLSDSTTTIDLSPQQLVDGFVLCLNNAQVTLNLPNVNALNAYLNTNLVSGANAIVANATNSAPRTCFRLSVCAEANVRVGSIAAQPAGHALGFSGYQYASFPLIAADAAIVPLALATSIPAIPLNAASKPVVDIYFIQVANATSSDPEWLITPVTTP